MAAEAPVALTKVKQCSGNIINIKMLNTELNCVLHAVYACDSVPLDRKKILMRFADKKSLPNFEGKPKILIFQVRPSLLLLSESQKVMPL